MTGSKSGNKRIKCQADRLFRFFRKIIKQIAKLISGIIFSWNPGPSVFVKTYRLASLLIFVANSHHFIIEDAKKRLPYRGATFPYLGQGHEQSANPHRI